MQTPKLSTLHPAHSRDALRKLREAAESEAAAVPPGVIAVTGGDIDFDAKHNPVKPMVGDPNDSAGAATYPGQNSEHIGNGHGGPQ